MGIRVTVELTREKSGSRPSSRTEDVVFNPATNARIAQVLAPEINLFGYPDRSQPGQAPEGGASTPKSMP